MVPSRIRIPDFVAQRYVAFVEIQTNAFFSWDFYDFARTLSSNSRISTRKAPAESRISINVMTNEVIISNRLNPNRILAQICNPS